MGPCRFLVQQLHSKPDRPISQISIFQENPPCPPSPGLPSPHLLTRSCSRGHYLGRQPLPRQGPCKPPHRRMISTPLPNLLELELPQLVLPGLELVLGQCSDP